mmetsp:Transcript_24180/g.58780  ORF Transcript_24180/g.58780 Transcript_24180/m.58780 type:complete len:175 (-) Transcript_24180:53-577(-)
MQILAASAVLSVAFGARVEVKPRPLRVSDLQKTETVSAVHKELIDDVCDVEKLKSLISDGVRRLDEMKDLLGKEGAVMKQEEADLKRAGPKVVKPASRSIEAEKAAMDYQAREMALDMETIKAEVETLKDAKRNKDEICALFHEAQLEDEAIKEDQQTMRDAEAGMEVIEAKLE